MSNKAGKHESFFSIPFDLITLGDGILYDLFVNSSSRESREKFVRIFPKGEVIEEKDVKRFKAKYHQVYVPEKQRGAYLKSLVKNDNLEDVEKTEVIKDSAIQHLSKIFDDSKEFTTEVLEDAIKGCKDSVESMIDVVQDYDIDDLQKLIGELSFHDFYTYDHSINVSMYCIALFRAVRPKASKEEITVAGLGGLLHDIGKLKIPNSIINNPEKLTDEEFDIIKLHPTYGKELIEEHHVCEGEVDWDAVIRVVYEHHENFNGTGYPNKVKGEDIHFLARITAIADFFDAITTKRSYHEVLKVEDALAVMEKTSGKKLDPELFEVFTSKVNNLVLEGKSFLELSEDFDPCQPHSVLPFKKPEPKKQNHDLFKKEQNYGKVKKEDKKKKPA